MMQIVFPSLIEKTRHKTILLPSATKFKITYHTIDTSTHIDNIIKIKGPVNLLFFIFKHRV